MKKKAAIVGVAIASLLATKPVLAEGIPNYTPARVQVTAYCEPGVTVTGSGKTKDIIASERQWLGSVAAVYKVSENGAIGDYMGLYSVEDIGYGAPTGFGKSEFSIYDSAGTIETGLTFDFREPTDAECLRFMKETYTGSGSTGSEVYIQIIRGKG